MELIKAIFIFVAVLVVRGEDGVKVAKIDLKTSSSDIKISLDEERPSALKSPEQDGVQKQITDHIGSSLVTLNYENCLTKECTLGNFVTDAMIYAYTESAPAGSWSSASIAIVNPDIFKASIDAGEIYLTDLQKAIPEEYTVDVADIQGKYLREMFEYNSTDDNMIQVSGIKIEYNFENPEGSRIQSLKTRCQDCETPVYQPLVDDSTYRIILPSHMSNGEGEFSTLLTRLSNIQTGPANEEVFISYIAAQSPIFKEEGDRITVYGREDPGGGEEGGDDNTGGEGGGGGGGGGGNGDDAGGTFVPSVLLLMAGLFMCVY